MIRQNFACLLKNPSLHPSAREVFTREALHTQDAEVAEEIRKRDLRKKEVVEKAKFHYNSRPGAHRRRAARAATGEGLWGCLDSGGATGPRAHTVAAVRGTEDRKGVRPATSRSTSRVSTNGFISYSTFPSRHQQGLGWGGRLRASEPSSAR